MASNIKNYKAWFESPKTISEISKSLEQAGLIKSPECDYENVYEWFEADTLIKGVRLNVSRKHCGFENFENEPVHVMLMYNRKEPDDEDVERIAQSIAEVNNASVSLGSIVHKGGDDFEYLESRSINS